MVRGGGVGCGRRRDGLPAISEFRGDNLDYSKFWRVSNGGPRPGDEAAAAGHRRAPAAEPTRDAGALRPGARRCARRHTPHARSSSAPFLPPSQLQGRAPSSAGRATLLFSVAAAFRCTSPLLSGKDLVSPDLHALAAFCAD